MTYLGKSSGKLLGWVAVLAVACTMHGQQAGAPQEPAAVQQPSATQSDAGAFKIQVTSQNVVLDVVVHDKRGKNVKGLTKDDFDVFEDKQPQKIVAFEEVDGPAPGAAATPGVAINSTEELDRLEPGAPVSIIVIDEVTTKFADLSYAREMLKKYLHAQGDTLGEPTMLVSANFKNIAVLRDYTTSRTAILDALDHHFADYASMARSGDWQAERINATFGSLLGVAQATAGHRGHKNVIWIGRGFPAMSASNSLSPETAAFNSALAMITRQLRDSRVTLYALDPAGINPLPEDRDENNLMAEDPLGGQVDFDMIARATGGKAIHGRNDVDVMIDESVRDGENFYTLSYRPSVKSDDLKQFRKIKVELKNPDLRASARKGYFVGAAPVTPVADEQGKLSKQLKFDVGTASASMLVYDAIPMTITRDEKSPDSFLVHLKAGDLPLEANATQTTSADIIVMAVAYDRKGKVLNHNARDLTVRMKTQPPASGADVRPVMIPVTIATAKPAARIRFIVRANGNGKIGADNFFLVDRSQIADPASGVDATKKY
jgi:VWFA-related protein